MYTSNWHFQFEAKEEKKHIKYILINMSAIYNFQSMYLLSEVFSGKKMDSFEFCPATHAMAGLQLHKPRFIIFIVLKHFPEKTLLSFKIPNSESTQNIQSKKHQ